MKRNICSIGLLLAILVLTGAALYWNGTYVVYILAYSFSFALLLCCTVSAASARLEKLIQIAVYFLILAAQILFVVLVTRPADGAGQSPELCRLSNVWIILVPFLVRHLWGKRT